MILGKGKFMILNGLKKGWRLTLLCPFLQNRHFINLFYNIISIGISKPLQLLKTILDNKNTTKYDAKK